MKRPGIVIVTFYSEREISRCLAAVPCQRADVVVVDNASGDGTVEEVRKHPEVRLIVNPRNYGFARAVNQGIAALETECVLVLNPDAVLESDFSPLVRALKETDVGAAAGRLSSLDGDPQTGFSIRCFPTAWSLAFEALGLNRLWKRNPVNVRYRCLDFDYELPADVEQPAGAFLMISRDAWRQVGGFDEEFFPVWFEDADFLLRLREAGFRVCYVPSVTARHDGGHSVIRLDDRCRCVYWYGSLLRYVSKHFSPLGQRGVCIAVAIGSLLRMLVSALQARSLVPIAVYGEVTWLAGRFLLTGRVRGAGGFAAAGTTT